MEDFNDDSTEIILEQIAFVSAAGAAGRFSEAFRNLDNADAIYSPAARRREAFEIASIEGATPRRENLARLIGDRQLTGIERDTKLAVDMYDALTKISTFSSENLDTKAIAEAFSLSDISAGRLMRADVIWSIEEDSQWLAQILVGLEEECNPWTAIETIRQIWLSGRFFGKNRRMAMLFAPFILQRGFESEAPLYGISHMVRRNIHSIRESAQHKEEWAGLFADALAKALKIEITAIRDVPALRATLLALCPPQRSSSSVGRAVDYILGNPAFRALKFTEALELTDRGGKTVLDRLFDANVLEIEGGAQNRLFLCRRAI